MTLIEQWTAAFGPMPVSGLPPPLPADAEPSTEFRRRCLMAAVSQAVTVSGENPATANHVKRVALATAITNQPLSWIDAIAAACASQGLDNTSLDAAIATSVSAIWNTLAGS
jgi:hypothetical protein